MLKKILSTTYRQHANNKRAYTNAQLIKSERKMGFVAVFLNMTRRRALP